MDKKSTYAIAGIFLIAIALYVFISFQKNALLTDSVVTSGGNDASTTAWENTPAQPVVTPKTVITAKHAYRNGEHIIAGELPLPTPCDILETSAVTGSDKKTVLFQFVSSVKSGEVCAQMITPARFKISAVSDKNAKLTATLNNQVVTLNLIEAGPTENLDDFELYIKG